MRSPIIALQHRRAERGQHPGLLLQRYLCEKATGEGGNPEEKRAILQAAIHAAANEEVRTLYRIAFARWSASLRSDPRPVDLATTGRLIVGLGSENILETGIRLHHTYGMPILPGSALKGLAAHYCDQVWGDSDEKFKKKGGVYHELLFGTTDESGCINFHDAWLTPESQSPLVLDVMTPHHPDYNRDPKTDRMFLAPTDFDSPTPVPFLSVTGTFRVAVSWYGPEHNEARCWTERAKELLCEALKDWGIGGKTSSGYGRLVDPKETTTSSAAATPGAMPKPVQRASPAPDPDRVTVEVLERRDVGGKVQFFVQEEGKPRGVLAYGTPPTDKMPEVGDNIVVYRNNRDPRNPQYRWDRLITDRPQGGSGGQRPRGRR